MKQDYLAQAKQFKAANVGLYGIGVQCHFGNEQEPNAAVIKVKSLICLLMRCCALAGEGSFIPYDPNSFVPTANPHWGTLDAEITVPFLRTQS